MSAEQIRERVRTLQVAKLRGYFISAAVALAAIGISFYVGLLRAQGSRPPGTPERIIVALIAILLCGGLLRRLLTSYRVHGSIWPRIVTRDAELMSCVDFYRRELEDRLNRLSHPKIRLLYVIVGLLPLFLFKVVATSQSIPIRTVLLPLIASGLLIGICVLLLFSRLKREMRELRREIDQLNESAKQL